MYLHHFRLTQLPFTLTPDTQFFCELPTYREALNVLLIALQGNEGFIKITGKVGTGKTMLCRILLNELQPPFVTAYIPNPHLTPDGLRIAIADELGIKYTRHTRPSQLLKLLNDYLISAAEQQSKPVLIIDEAQSMSLETLEALRLLTNLETEKQKLLQIVLFGQPELDTLLQDKSIRQLRQRITFNYRLHALNFSDIKRYLSHRLAAAGNFEPDIFSPMARYALYCYSRGIPRLTNILAHKAMLAAFGKGATHIHLSHMQLAALDTEATKKSVWFWRGSLYITMGLILSFGTYFWPTLRAAL